LIYSEFPSMTTILRNVGSSLPSGAHNRLMMPRHVGLATVRSGQPLYRREHVF
jgi:hypothetical protein